MGKTTAGKEMDFIDLSLSKTKSSRKKKIPVHYKKRCNANLSNSIFNHEFIIGVYKRKIKSLLQNNKSLVLEVQNYRCKSSSKAKMLADTSVAAMEHIFSARLKLNNLAAVLKEAYLSVEEILSILQLCSSVYPSKFILSKKSSPKSHPVTIPQSFVPITELQESFEKLHENFSTKVLEANQGSPTCNGIKSGYHDNLPSGSSESETSIEMPHELNAAQKSVKRVAVASKLTKVTRNSKVSSSKTRKRKNPESKASNKLTSAMQVQLPNEGLKNLHPPISDLVHQTEVLEDVAAKRNKLFVEPSVENKKQWPVKQKLPLTLDKYRRKNAHWRRHLVGGENTACTDTDNGSGENSEVDSIICHIDQLQGLEFGAATSLVINQNSGMIESGHPNLSQDPKQNKSQSHSSYYSPKDDHKLSSSEDLLQEDTSKLNAKPKAKKLSKNSKLVHDLCSDSSSKSAENMMLKGITTNKHNTRYKVNFCFDSDEITNERTRKQKKRCHSKIQNGSENESASNNVSSQRPVLQQVDNKFCINKQVGTNSFIVAAEVHSPPSHCVNKIQSISTNYFNKNMQPCVVLTDIFEENKSIYSQDDLTSCSKVQHNKNPNSEVSMKYKNESSMHSENSSPKQSTRVVARCRPEISYKEPKLNQKMRRLN